MRHVREKVAAAEALGLREVRVEHHGAHPALCGTAPHGRTIRILIAGSPSDSRAGLEIFKTQLRIAMGRPSGTKRVGARRARRRRVQTPGMPPTPMVQVQAREKPDPRDALLEMLPLRDQFRVLLEREEGWK
jgi:hypothetical protein